MSIHRKTHRASLEDRPLSGTRTGTYWDRALERWHENGDPATMVYVIRSLGVFLRAVCGTSVFLSDYGERLASCYDALKGLVDAYPWKMEHGGESVCRAGLDRLPKDSSFLLRDCDTRIDLLEHLGVGFELELWAGALCAATCGEDVLRWESYPEPKNTEIMLLVYEAVRLARRARAECEALHLSLMEELPGMAPLATLPLPEAIGEVMSRFQLYIERFKDRYKQQQREIMVADEDDSHAILGMKFSIEGLARCLEHGEFATVDEHGVHVQDRRYISEEQADVVGTLLQAFGAVEESELHMGRTRVPTLPLSKARERFDVLGNWQATLSASAPWFRFEASPYEDNSTDTGHDSRDYMPLYQALKLWGREQRTPADYKALDRVLASNEWIRRRLVRSRREVRAGDWAMFCRLYEKQKVDLDTFELLDKVPAELVESIADDVRGSEARKAEIRKKKQQK